MVAKDFPCKICTHHAFRHFTNIAGDKDLCLDCAVQPRPVDPNEHWHTFEGDNFRYLELQTKRQELRNE